VEKIMIGSLLSSVGGSIGKYLGGGILSSIGRYAGKLAGDYLEKKWFKRSTSSHRFTNVHDSFHISMAKYGTPIPLTFGRVQLPGQIIWADQILEKRNSSSVKKYIKGANIDVTKETTELEYFLSFAMCICIGEINDIERVWLDDDVIDISKYKFKLYKGDEAQLPDPTITKQIGRLTPAYRGIAYIVFEELPLAEFGHIIPSFSFEVLRKANVKDKVSVEEMVESIVMIPGSGEFVYDTKIQTKSRLSEHGQEVNSKKLNSHNHYNLPNSVYSLNQLKTTCSNVKWVSPVACWFGNDLDIENCLIRPAVEFKNAHDHYSEEWKVSTYNRATAPEVSKDENSNPKYGGSINDASIIRYLSELRKRELNIMFYPMFLMDTPGKPWRGRITGSHEHVTNFFNREDGYNQFILHYANLVKDHVDAFVIGSELIGLTKIRNGDNFPAVEELVALAARVKEIVGENVKVTYAADWSEYHHTEGGWFNLDPLWASPNIDFIGIDAYFPITNTISSDISKEEIQKGFNSGEGYDYYIDQENGEKIPLAPQYAWKNLKYWWENVHQNPNEENSDWVPRSKPIWFTEFGFPSIDKATNQPNVFFDDKCVDGGAPKHSSGETNFSIQRTAIRAFIEFWKTQEYIEEMFLWCWDARPYPAWPVSNVWSDGRLWEKGHWVNYKFGSSNLSSILLEISDRCGIDLDKIDIDSVDEKVEGLIFSNSLTALNAINTLRAAYFFDINADNKDIISFQKRGADKKTRIVNDRVMQLTDNSYIETTKTTNASKIKKIGLHYINYSDNYNAHYTQLHNEENAYTRDVTISLPIVLTTSEARTIGASILKNAHNENEFIRLKIYDSKIDITPSDFIKIDHNLKTYVIRVIEISSSNNQSIIIGIIDNQYNYSFTPSYLDSPQQTSRPYIDNELIALDLPIRINNASGSYIAIYWQGGGNTALYSDYPSGLGQWGHITNIKPTNAICEIINFQQSSEANIFVLDTKSRLIIAGSNIEKYASNDWQYAQAGEELIKFKDLRKLENGNYEISQLIRGLSATEKYIPSERDGEKFILLECDPNILEVSELLKDQQISFKAGKIKKTIKFQDKSQKELPAYITHREINDDILHIKWIYRTNLNDDWMHDFSRNEISYKITIASDEETHEFIEESNEININIAELELSDDFKITIIPQ